MAELSPMMQQYFEIKKDHKDEILFFRLGDFYEMFFDDAKLASKELELVLTGRDCGQEERAPMCGVPYHSYESYVARLIKKGYKVAICEQMEDPALAKGIVKREITRVITPGTIIESSMLDESSNNYICSVSVDYLYYGICFCDVTTGKLICTEGKAEGSLQKRIIEEISIFSPSEIVFGNDYPDLSKTETFLKERFGCSAEHYDEGVIDFDNAKRIVSDHFNKDYSELGFKGKEGVRCVASLLCYIKNTQKKGIERISSIRFYTKGTYMALDYTAKKNLEITETLRGKEKRGTLLWVLDKTHTSMGRRLMNSYVSAPLIDVDIINERLNAVEELVNNSALCDGLSEELSGIYDIERVITRIVFGNAGAKEYKSLEASIGRIPAIYSLLSGAKSELLIKLHDNIDLLKDVAELIANSINDDPPMTLKEGGVIKAKWNSELDELRNIGTNIKSLIADIEKRERERTGISKLKIGYNKVFGYYIEISNAFREMVPVEYIRKQTLSNCERYITEELKNLEEKALGAHDKILALEQKLFEEIRIKVASEVERIQNVAVIVATLDVLCSFAVVAVQNDYVKPVVDYSDTLDIHEGRHPVVEKMQRNTPFVPNDVYLDNSENQIAIITGPNMAGKSTYMRQTALIAIMAQAGSFVPAKKAHIGILDGVYTRVGASDDLSAGQSTFMVEMSEVAEILSKATSKSLLILDEIGRGTSTFDGMSIAHAVLEHIANRKKLGAKTLFATHYHELIELENSYPNVKNYNIAVKKRGEDITFLRRIIRGGADDSYGIEVAKLAGIPISVVKRAREILSSLDKGRNLREENITPIRDDEGIGQISLFSSSLSETDTILKNTDVETLTPIEALNLLYELKTKLGNRG